MRTTKAELLELKQEFETELENLKAANQRYANSQQHSAEIKQWHKTTDELTDEIIEWHKVGKEQSRSIELLSKQSEIDKPKIENYKKEIEEMITLFKKQKEDIQEIIDDANRASMAGAFKKQADDINGKMRWTDGFLIVALLGVVGISYWGFVSSFNPESTLIWSQFLAKASIGLPLLIVAWIKARERAYLFRLREDYAYKYSSAMAFEGYKKQIQEQDPEMQKQLLQIALDNLGDKPTKVFEKEINVTPIETAIDKVAQNN
ncbi:hypothetical protein C8D76_103161 [Pasteurella langaaensis DSM 22999]|uniref:Uncharacterized protein n=1 Tax=Alitibacter langaaensis DSM 22999 TaxID=1122935 RepID=A0A2U0TAK7_9PAST|nr:hypothetical protein [Pasteurella langaaensis]PVX40587.1 hypothetical protein C8D76_103161 [Pasteurella langaaensis DSM 22999]